MAKKALISTVEPRESGYRVAQVEDAANTFEVGSPLFWTPCADDVVADQFWYDPSDELIKANPVVVEAAPAEIPAPTKEELAAQLASLQAQIAALQ
jgi:hypothetical protein